MIGNIMYIEPMILITSITVNYTSKRNIVLVYKTFIETSYEWSDDRI